MAINNNYKLANPANLSAADVKAKAPYNFVPLPGKTFVPDWAEQVCQDVPFSDGMSGSISLQITADSDIFVRNGHTKADAEAKDSTYRSFSKDPDNRYFIPATSLKGSIRSVLEVMSFSAMTQVNDSVFGQRDLNNKAYTSGVRNSLCGWLRIEGDKYILKECGEPARVKMWEIDEDLHLDYKPLAAPEKSGKTGEGALTRFILGCDFQNDYNKCARRKYEVIYESRHMSVKLDGDKVAQDKFLFEDDYVSNMRSSNGDGIYVLTGQPGKPTYDPNKVKPVKGKNGNAKGCWTNKVSEFLFPGDTNSGHKIEIDDETYSRFAEVHQNSLDFTNFWVLRLRRGLPIPVFYHKAGGKVTHIGLSFMYKIPFKNSVTQAIPGYTAALERRDMARCIFGDTSLRGRVMFGNAYAQGTPQTYEKTTVSGAPHASYYPLYMRYGDWNQKDARISGWKRYPARQTTHYNNEGTDGMEQISSLLRKGARFKAIVRFFNLRPAELGALLSALTWHGDSSCRHGIGFGKPYGYGVTKIEACLDGVLNGREVECMKAFEETMNVHCGGSWLGSETINQLFAMARPVKQGDNVKFEYLKMSTNRSDNEFLIVKNSGDHLKFFTVISPTSAVPPAGVSCFRPLAASVTSVVPTIAPVVNYSSVAVGDEIPAKCGRAGFVSIENRQVEMEVDGNSKMKKKLVGKTVIVKVLSVANGNVTKVEFVR